MTIKELRCSKCNKKLLEYEESPDHVYSPVKVEIICSRCKEKNKVEIL